MLDMYLTWEDVHNAGDDLDPATDVLALGKLVTTLLRHVTQAESSKKGSAGKSSDM